MQLAERILRELAVSPLLTRQLAARLEAVPSLRDLLGLGGHNA